MTHFHNRTLAGLCAPRCHFGDITLFRCGKTDILSYFQQEPKVKITWFSAWSKHDGKAGVIPVRVVRANTPGGNRGQGFNQR
ncbi:hypothetical protein THTE_2246 [Thermogutta terrifontis]|uniref:Uncharacterized protein n=1 Tax=Thermogutta terrifontis TaxID=1331910 RepID=A0A286RFV5_9BACT|nr:hypothetical protein THTE_2246 [Thermogutta terrifontis]